MLPNMYILHIMLNCDTSGVCVCVCVCVCACVYGGGGGGGRCVRACVFCTVDASITHLIDTSVTNVRL